MDVNSLYLEGDLRKMHSGVDRSYAEGKNMAVHNRHEYV